MKELMVKWVSQNKKYSYQRKQKKIKMPLNIICYNGSSIKK